MKKIYKLIVFLFILFFSNNIVAFNSSSYLISQSAFKNYDFTTVLHEFSNNNRNFQINNHIEELISSTIKVNIKLANKISKQILLYEPDNQEARLVLMTNYLINNNKKEFMKLRLDSSRKKMN